jgi:dipeptidyl aminopeptidase/acylaminoacyl peptidase
MQGAWDDEDELAISTRQDSEVRERSTDTLTSTTSFEQNAAGEIAYIHEGDIYLLDLATGDAKQLTNDGTNRDPTWMPDGEWLAFASNREGNYNIYMMLDDGSQLTRLTNDPRDERFPSYASEEILFFVRSVDTWQQHELVELDIHAGETVISSYEGRCDITDISAFSPNMFAIVNDCRLGVSATIYTRPDAAAAFTLSMVNNGGGVCDDSGQREYLAGSVTWMHTQPQLGIVGATCPDGDAANWDVGLFLTPAEQSEESVQVVSEENVGYFDWSPDDRLIVYDQRNTYSPQFNDTIREGLWLLNVASGVVQPVLDTGHSPAWRPAVAPDPPEQTSDTAPTSKATPKILLDQLVEFPVPAIAQCVTLTICLW